jgi:hypothetical protein
MWSGRWLECGRDGRIGVGRRRNRVGIQWCCSITQSTCWQCLCWCGYCYAWLHAICGVADDRFGSVLTVDRLLSGAGLGSQPEAGEKPTSV